MIPDRPEYRLLRKLDKPTLGIGLGLGLSGGNRTGPAAVTDFANQNYGAYAFTDIFTFTRASSATNLLSTDPAGFSYTTFGTDAPAIHPTDGICLFAEARTQLLANPAAPVTQVVTIAATGIHCLWINVSASDPTASVTITPGTATLTSSSTASSAAGTPLVSVTATQGVPAQFTIATTGTITVTVVGTVRTFQLELGTGPTSFIPTTTARAAEKLVPKGALASILAGASAAVVFEAKATRATPTFGCLLKIGNNVLGKNNFDSGFFGGNDQGGDAAFYGACGLGDLSDTKIGITWAPSGRKICANGGLCSLSSNSIKVINSVNYEIGNNSGQFWNGTVKKISFYNVALSAPALRSAVSVGLPAPDWIMPGDSITMRGDGPMALGTGHGKSIPQMIGTLLGKNVVNGGKGGDSSTAILNRYAAHPELWGIPLILGPTGWNNVQSSTATVKADIAAITAMNTSGRVVVMTIPYGSSATEQTGGTRHTNIKDVNDWIISTYGTAACQIDAALIAAADPADVADVADAAIGITPAKLRLAVARTTTTAIDNVVTTFSSWGRNWSTAINTLVRFSDEYILVTAANSTTVQVATRGYGGTTPVSHASGTAYSEIDVIHLSQDGRTVAAAAGNGTIATLGWS